jgi:hypothetical protein
VLIVTILLVILVILATLSGVVAVAAFAVLWHKTPRSERRTDPWTPCPCR